jgi:pyruvate dehydrogenase E1 component alpha subunit
LSRPFETHLTVLPAAEQIALFRRMLLIRRSEERLARDFKAGLLPGPVHLYIGQEAVAVGVCAHLGDSDWITSTHRGHGHFLAKGGDVAGMFGEIHGRATGICGGLGGSMHVADIARGILGANGIVAGGMAIATGAALAQKLDGASGVAITFFGDGATGEGVLAESLNIAALWRLPVVFVCENNFYSEFSPVAKVIAGEIVDRAKPYGVPAVVVDGNDLDAVWLAAGEAIRNARAGEGPSFIEARTYRFHGHVEGETAFIKEAYRSASEVEARRASDPLESFRKRLIASGAADEGSLRKLDEEVVGQVDEAADRALDAPWPSIERLAEFVLA